MKSLEARVNEVELLRSMYSENEILLNDKELFHKIKQYLKLGIETENFNLDLTIKLENKIELTIQLPDGYPSWDAQKPVKPLFTLRLLSGAQEYFNNRELSSKLDAYVDEISLNGGPILCEVLLWLQNELKKTSNTHLETSNSTHSMVSPENTDVIVCLWIVSHHIRSPIKRQLIRDWSSELKLAGCCMPGKPGLIVAEGEAQNADEYWRRLRNLQWKHIQLRDREVLGTGHYTTRRFLDGFHEIDVSHQSRYAWLNQHNVSSEQFQLVFGIPGRLSQRKNN